MNCESSCNSVTNWCWKEIAVSRKRYFLELVCASVLLGGISLCYDSSARGQSSSVAERARSLAEESLVADAHIDTPYQIEFDFEDVTQASDVGNFDYPRAIEGGLDVVFMSILTPPDYEFQENGKATAHALKMLGYIDDWMLRAPDKFYLLRSSEDVRKARHSDKIGISLGMENGAPIEGDLDNLAYFYERGFRYMTLAHARSNHLADSSFDEARPNNGLSTIGERVVKEMNAIGMIIDVSHLSDEAFWDVIAATTAPVIASHSNARHFTPGFERNMSDEMIKAVAAAGGAVMINFGSVFLTEEAHKYSIARGKAYRAWLDRTGRKVTRATRSAREAQDIFWTQYEKDHPFPYAGLSDVLDQIDHIVDIASVDNVGIGSDFDGVYDTLPTGLKDVSDYPNLIEGLFARGYSKNDIKKIVGGNLIRVWRAVEARAAEIRTQR